jgi:hypothetical protein
VGLFYYFVRLFTVDLGAKFDKETISAIDKMVQFCYCFIFTSFFLVFLPFFAWFMLSPDLFSSLYTRMFGSPFSLVLGCVEDRDPEHAYGEDVCGNRNEWLINLGGSVQPFTQFLPLPLPANNSADTSASPTPTPAPAATSAMVDDSSPKTHTARAPEDSESLHSNSVAQSTPFIVPMAVVSGGVTVPFYFVIVALLGASISLTRKVPEYQAQIATGSVIPADIRRDLIIQVLQFVCAPFLAVIGYAVIAPSGQTELMALAFAAGFSSQTILSILMIAMNQLENALKKPTERHEAQQRIGDPSEDRDA